MSNRDDRLIYEGWKDIAAAAGLGLAAGCSPSDPNCPGPFHIDLKDPNPNTFDIQWQTIDLSRFKLKGPVRKVKDKGKIFYYGKDDKGIYMAAITESDPVRPSDETIEPQDIVNKKKIQEVGLNAHALLKSDPLKDNPGDVKSWIIEDNNKHYWVSRIYIRTY